MEISDDGTKYLVNADQFFFRTENKKNHTCPNCGSGETWLQQGNEMNIKQIEAC
mgnify:CR=1 FL=1